MQIYRAVTRVPGGMMVVPLFLGMSINTFAPNLMKIGGFTQALTGVGYPTILGMYLFTVGTKMTVRAAPKMMLRGFGHHAREGRHRDRFCARRRRFFGGHLLGLSTLAVMVAMSDTNGGMFLALTSVMGSKDDAGTYVAQSIETGPFLTMLIFVGAGLAVIPWLTMVSVIAPIVVGAILGNLDDDLRQFFGSHEPIIVPFMAFTLGQTINLASVVTAGIPGVLLGRDRARRDRLRVHPGRSAARRKRRGRRRRVEHRREFCGRSPGGGPGRPFVCRRGAAATVQVAASVIVTAILTPLLTSWWFRRVSDRSEVKTQNVEVRT